MAHPHARMRMQAEDSEHLLKEEPRVEFSGDEGLGRYLDLHDSFQRFVNGEQGQ
jgi:splicing factor 3A subunit 3